MVGLLVRDRIGQAILQVHKMGIRGGGSEKVERALVRDRMGEVARHKPQQKRFSLSGSKHFQVVGHYVG